MNVILEYKDGDEIEVYVNDIETETKIEKKNKPSSCRIEG